MCIDCKIVQQKQFANHYDDSNGGDRYLSVPAFLVVLLAISMVVIWDRHSELNNAVDTNKILKNQVMDLLADLLTAEKEKTNSDSIIADLHQRVEKLDRDYEKLSQQYTTEKKSLNSLVEELTRKTDTLENEAIQLRKEVSQLKQKYMECSDRLIIALKDFDEVRKKEGGGSTS